VQRLSTGLKVSCAVRRVSALSWLHYQQRSSLISSMVVESGSPDALIRLLRSVRVCKHPDRASRYGTIFATFRPCRVKTTVSPCSASFISRANICLASLMPVSTRTSTPQRQLSIFSGSHWTARQSLRFCQLHWIECLPALLTMKYSSPDRYSRILSRSRGA